MRVRYLSPAPLNGDDLLERTTLAKQPWSPRVVRDKQARAAPPPSPKASFLAAATVTVEPCSRYEERKAASRKLQRRPQADGRRTHNPIKEDVVLEVALSDYLRAPRPYLLANRRLRCYIIPAIHPGLIRCASPCFFYSFFYVRTRRARNLWEPSRLLPREAILIDVDTGTVLFEKNADKLFAPASMSKIMTLEVLFKKLKAGEISLDTEFPVSLHAWKTGGAPRARHPCSFRSTRRRKSAS